MASSGHGTAIAILAAQPLWLSALGPHETGALPQSIMGWAGPDRAILLPMSNWLLMDSKDSYCL